MHTYQMTKDQQKESPYWIEMVQYLVLLAISNTSLIGVNRALLNKKSAIGRSFQDYKRTLDILIQERIILIDDAKLLPGKISNASWIKKGLEVGSEEIWELAEKIEPNLKWAKKYDNTELIEIGRKGEDAVVEFLCNQIDQRYHHKIKHVSNFDDTAGFDIASPSIVNHEKMIYLEVKTTVKPSKDFTFYISRNEFAVGSKTLNWSIVCVKITNSNASILGHITLDQISDLFPRELSNQAEWQSLKVTVPQKLINDGLY